MGATKGYDIFVPTLTWAWAWACDKFPRMTNKCYSIHEVKSNA